jgi:thioredoxin-like negative regulator of GroEL
MSSEAVTAGIEQETPRLLFFYEQRSGKSRRADGFLAHVLQRGGNHQTFVIHRVEVGQRPDLAQRFKVTATPTLLVVEDKKVQARLESPTGCEDIELLLRPWLQSHNGVQPRPAPQHPNADVMIGPLSGQPDPQAASGFTLRPRKQDTALLPR